MKQTSRDVKAVDNNYKWSAEVTIVFHPTKACNSTQIVFVQSTRSFKKNRNLIKGTKQNQARETKDGAPQGFDPPGGYYIDVFDNCKYAWYDWNENEDKPKGLISPGSSPPPVDATLTDSPKDFYSDMRIEYETAAIAKEGKDKNTLYSSLNWNIDVDATCNVSLDTPSSSSKSKQWWDRAVEEWNKQAGLGEGDRNKNHPQQQALPKFKEPPAL